MQHHAVSSQAQMLGLLLLQKYWQNTESKFAHEQNQSPDPI